MQEPPLGVEDQLLGGEPAHALHEAALDLADVDRRVQRAPAIVQDVDAHDPVLAGEGVDDDLGAGRPVGEVEERPAAALGPVPGDLRRLVEAGLRELDPRLDAAPRELAEGEALVADEDPVVAEHDLGLGHAMRRGGDAPPCGA